MSKTAVYSWRVDPELKSALAQVAHAEKTSVARLLDRIVQEWLRRESPAEEDEVQRRLHVAARHCFGTLLHGTPDLAEQAKKRVRLKIRERHAGQRAH